MLTAVAEAVAEKGLARVSVADVIARAGVSRETFYEQFSDKEDCFLNALDAGVEGMLGVMRAALALPASTPVERLDLVLGAYLDALAAEPTLAKAYLIDAYGAGARATRRRIELQRRFVDMFAGIFEISSGPGSRDWFACEALVAAVSSLVTARVGEGRAAELPELREPILGLVPGLLPGAVRSGARRRGSAR
jgi:AcrR family transcriptional regulator